MMIKCCDCMSRDGMPSLANNSVNLVLTDIPYAEVNRASGGLRSLDKSTADVATFALAPFVTELVRVCSGSFYIFCGFRQVSELVCLFSDAKLSVRVGFWRKTNPSPMNGDSVWLSAVECCVFAKKSGATFNRHCAAPVWTHATCESKIHDTQKPESLFQELVLSSTESGNVVLDPCMGSGTTGIACHVLGCEFIGYEQDSDYFLAAARRLASATAQPMLGFKGAKPTPAVAAAKREKRHHVSTAQPGLFGDAQ